MVHPVSSFGIHLQSPVRCFNPSFIFRLNIFFFHVYIASLQLECFTSLPLTCEKWAVSPRPYSVQALIAFVFLPSLLHICTLSLAL